MTPRRLTIKTKRWVGFGEMVMRTDLHRSIGRVDHRQLYQTAPNQKRYRVGRQPQGTGSTGPIRRFGSTRWYPLDWRAPPFGRTRQMVARRTGHGIGS